MGKAAKAFISHYLCPISTKCCQDLVRSRVDDMVFSGWGWVQHGWLAKRNEDFGPSGWCQDCGPVILLMEEIRLTSWYGKYPMIYTVLYIPGGAGFLPLTAWAVLTLVLTCWIHKIGFSVPLFPVVVEEVTISKHTRGILRASIAGRNWNGQVKQACWQ